MRYLTLCAAALFACGCSTTLKGTVTDAKTQQPLPGATVRVGEETTTTDSEGFYVLDADDDDEPQQLHVQAPGYAAKSERRVIRDEPDPAFVNFELKRQDEDGGMKLEVNETHTRTTENHTHKDVDKQVEKDVEVEQDVDGAVIEEETSTEVETETETETETKSREYELDDDK
ncbi:MAG: carboxypeptidase-like regulatory domain-containing protein [Planctomycetota bacterium]